MDPVANLENILKDSLQSGSLVLGSCVIHSGKERIFGRAKFWVYLIEPLTMLMDCPNPREKGESLPPL